MSDDKLFHIKVFPSCDCENYVIKAATLEEAKAKCDEIVANYRKELTICKTICQIKWMDNPKWLDDKIYSLARRNKDVRPDEVS